MHVARLGLDGYNCLMCLLPLRVGPASDHFNGIDLVVLLEFPWRHLGVDDDCILVLINLDARRVGEGWSGKDQKSERHQKASHDRSPHVIWIRCKQSPSAGGHIRPPSYTSPGKVGRRGP